MLGEFFGLDTSITFAFDGQRQRGVFESVADGIGDDGIADDFMPVGQRELRGERGGFAVAAFFGASASFVKRAACKRESAFLNECFDLAIDVGVFQL